MPPRRNVLDFSGDAVHGSRVVEDVVSNAMGGVTNCVGVGCVIFPIVEEFLSAVAEEDVGSADDAILVSHVLLAIAFGHVGEEEAFESPFVAEDGDLGILVRASPDWANAVERGHDGVGLSFVDGPLEWIEKEFAGFLFIEPDGDSVAIGFFVIEGEVLQVGDDAFLLHADDFAFRADAGEEGILAEVFVGTANEGGAVEVDARGPHALDIVEMGVFRDGVADFL